MNRSEQITNSLPSCTKRLSDRADSLNDDFQVLMSGIKGLDQIEQARLLAAIAAQVAAQLSKLHGN